MDTEIETMRKAIAKLSGRMPISTDVGYLSRRLADLRKSAKEGEATRFEYAEPNAVIAASMPSSAKEATTRVARKLGMGVSELVRRSLADYMRANGHAKEADSFGTDSSE